MPESKNRIYTGSLPLGGNDRLTKNLTNEAVPIVSIEIGNYINDIIVYNKYHSFNIYFLSKFIPTVCNEALLLSRR